MPLNSGWLGEKELERKKKQISFTRVLTYNKVNNFIQPFTKADFEEKSNLDWKMTFRMDGGGGGDSTKHRGSYGHKN